MTDTRSLLKREQKPRGLLFNK